ncbi:MULTISPECIES: class I SAM-dependent methyltransferase [Bacillaceae]|uniref:Methyltransferase domain-containing protein n=1 Tax=Evansella alkalicola TaxID=745819 RepID=A0ABS6JTG0_9BACI|nr:MULTISPECIES: methyltransferase domain-containing protein [Bacillaceae]MBU9721869.1 methyltransferase domain-containing protein [Bacillus alkalicola]
MSDYMDMLAAYGVTEARPGGKQMTEKLLSSYPLKEGMKVLEIGSGLGDTAALLSKYKTDVIALDSHKKMIKKAKSRFESIENIQWLCEDLHYANLKPKQFQAIFSESVLAFTNLNQSLPLLFEWLDSSGKLFALEPIYLGGLSNEALKQYKSFYGFNHMLTEKEWNQYFSNHKFKLEDIIHSEDANIGSFETSSFPDLIIDDGLDQEYVELMEKHVKFTEDYLGYFDFAYFILKK